MQLALGLGADEDVTWARDRLRSWFGHPAAIQVRTPIGQLVKSSISARTRDEVSLGAYGRLLSTYRTWADLAEAPAEDVEAVIGDVTFPDVKARNLGAALRAIAAVAPDFDLTFLARLSVPEALARLERLPGVGRKVAASTLNFSTLQMPAFVVDTHILRVLRRFGLVPPKADARAAYDAVMAISGLCGAADLAELHVLTKHLGQTVCRSDRACCRDCPIRPRCKAVGLSRARTRHPFTQSAQRSDVASGPQGMMGTLEVEFFGEPSITRSE